MEAHLLTAKDFGSIPKDTATKKGTPQMHPIN
jgi:hypothetical protein